MMSGRPRNEASTADSSVAGTLGRLGAKLLRIRAIVRFPIYLYWARLGFVFGSRLLLLEHVGRHTGARRYVVLEVVDHPSPSRYLVASGFGENSQWFANVQADPHVHVSVARHLRVPAMAHRLGRVAAAAAVAAYARRRGTPGLP